MAGVRLPAAPERGQNADTGVRPASPGPAPPGGSCRCLLARGAPRRPLSLLPPAALLRRPRGGWLMRLRAGHGGGRPRRRRDPGGFGGGGVGAQHPRGRPRGRCPRCPRPGSPPPAHLQTPPPDAWPVAVAPWVCAPHGAPRSPTAAPRRGVWVRPSAQPGPHGPLPAACFAAGLCRRGALRGHPDRRGEGRVRPLGASPEQRSAPSTAAAESVLPTPAQPHWRALPRSSPASPALRRELPPAGPCPGL